MPSKVVFTHLVFAACKHSKRFTVTVMFITKTSRNTVWCLNSTLFAPFSERRCGHVIKAEKKQRENAAEFLSLILCYAN